VPRLAISGELYAAARPAIATSGRGISCGWRGRIWGVACDAAIKDVAALPPRPS